ncbi:MAG: hypothetical protein ACW99U_12140 [Candidatus Thorarchaeota archaeon]
MKSGPSQRSDVLGESEILEMLMKIHPMPMTPSKFQDLQTRYSQKAVFQKSPLSIDFSDALSELLRVLKLSVVLDKQTSWSRTAWFSGQIRESPVLLVLDGVSLDQYRFLTLDVWSELENIDSAIVEVLGTTGIGEPAFSFDSLDFSWVVQMRTESEAQIVLTVSSDTEKNPPDSHKMYLTLDFQGAMSEACLTRPLARHEQVSIATGLEGSTIDESIGLDDPFISVLLTDAGWKPDSRSHRHSVPWREAVAKSLIRQATTGSRFRSYEDLVDSLGLAPYGNSEIVIRLFLELCMGLEVKGCDDQRGADHCKRSLVISGLTIGFNPPRGLSGYLEMVTSEAPSEILYKLGSVRTWREHISEIVHLAQDFTATPIQSTEGRTRRKRGRPPTQLIPVTPLDELLKALLNEPDGFVCRNCRFCSPEVQ